MGRRRGTWGDGEEDAAVGLPAGEQFHQLALADQPVDEHVKHGDEALVGQRGVDQGVGARKINLPPCT